MATNRRFLAAPLSPQDPAVKTVQAIGAGSNLDGRAVLVSTAGDIVGQLIEDTADQTYTVPVGIWPLAFKSITSATAVGKVLG